MQYEAVHSCSNTERNCCCCIAQVPFELKQIQRCCGLHRHAKVLALENVVTRTASDELIHCQFMRRMHTQRGCTHINSTIDINCCVVSVQVLGFSVQVHKGGRSHISWYKDLAQYCLVTQQHLQVQQYDYLEQTYGHVTALTCVHCTQWASFAVTDA